MKGNRKQMNSIQLLCGIVLDFLLPHTIRVWCIYPHLYEYTIPGSYGYFCTTSFGWMVNLKIEELHGYCTAAWKVPM